MAAKSIKGLSKGQAGVVAVQDGIANHLTGLGTSRDKNSATEYCAERILTTYELDALYQSNDLASTIVDKPVEDALRAGFAIRRPEGTAEDDKELAKLIMDRYQELNVDLEENKEYISRAACFGRLKGAAGLILIVKGSGSLASELELEKVTEIVELVDFDRDDMRPKDFTKAGKIETYEWTPRLAAYGAPTQLKPQTVHVSRVLLFPGARTTNQGRKQNMGWDFSVLQRVFNALKSFDSMFKSTDSMFADASQAVFKLQGLIEALAEQDGTGANDIQTRLAFMDMARSVSKAIMLEAGDKEGDGGEDFEVVERTTLGTLDGVIQQYYIRLAAAARMPLTVLLGMSPSGMDATGDSDMILYYNSVDVYRQTILAPRILKLLKLIAKEQGDEDYENWEICWPELIRPKPVDVATAEKMRVDSGIALVSGLAILPEELALNLKKIAPTLGIELDAESIKARQDALKEGLEEIANRTATSAEAQQENELELKKAGPPKAQPKGSPATKTSKRKATSSTAGRQT